MTKLKITSRSFVNTPKTRLSGHFLLYYLLSEIYIQCSVYFKTVSDICLKAKVKFTLEQPTKAQRSSRGIALLFP
jgi:hypothetical protein